MRSDKKKNLFSKFEVFEFEVIEETDEIICRKFVNLCLFVDKLVTLFPYKNGGDIKS